MRTSPIPNTTPPLGRWAVMQLWQFAWLICQLLLVGVVLAIWQRRFHWRAAAACSLSMGLLACLLGLLSKTNIPIENGPCLWSGVVITMLCAGFAAGRVSKRLCCWENYGAVLLVFGLAGLYLAYDGFYTQSPASFFSHTSKGFLWFGPMWDRLLLLLSVGCFLLTLVGSSLAFLLYGDDGQRDLHVTLEWLVAWRHVRGQRTHGMSITAFVAVFGIALGVAALIAVTAVMSGYQQDIQNKILATNAHLVIQKYGLDFIEYADIATQAKKLPEVVAASPFTFNEAMLSTTKLGVGVLLKGIDPQTASLVTSVENSLCQTLENQTCIPFADAKGQLQQLLHPQAEALVPRAIVGLTLFKRLGVPVGGHVTLTTPVGMSAWRNNTPKRFDVRIAGVFQAGMYEFDARLVYLDLPTTQALFSMGNNVNGVELRLQNPSMATHPSKQLISQLGRYPYRLLNWHELNAGFLTALKLQKIVMFLVLTCIVIVAAFNIASTLFMAVVERAMDIAILKSMGARDATIMKIFVFEGWLTGACGTMLGVLLGLGAAMLLAKLHIGIAADVYMVDSLQIRLEPFEIALTAVASLLIAHLATLYPAQQAAKQKPAVAMRHA